MIDIDFEGDGPGAVIDSARAFTLSLIGHYDSEPPDYTTRSALADWLFAAPEPREYAAFVMATAGVIAVSETVDMIFAHGVTSSFMVTITDPANRDDLEDLVIASAALREARAGNIYEMMGIMHRHVCPACGKRGTNNIGSCMNIGAHCVQVAYRSIETASHMPKRGQSDVSSLIKRFGTEFH